MTTIATDAGQTERTPSRFAMMRGTLLRDIGLPIGSYYLLKQFGANDFVALTAGGVVSGGIAAFGVLRSRKLDPVAAFMLGLFALGLIAAVITGDPRAVLAKDSLTTFVAGVAFLGSTLAAKPLLYHFAARAMGEGTERRRGFDTAYATVPAMRAKFRNASILWGVGFIAEAAVRLVLVYSLPVSVMVVGSTVLMVATMGVLFLITFRYLKPGK
jgi:hypothetical protein